MDSAETCPEQGWGPSEKETCRKCNEIYEKYNEIYEKCNEIYEKYKDQENQGDPEY